MGRADYYAAGEWNVTCAACGRKRKSSMVAKNWQGFWVCHEHNIPRQPQDFVTALPDDPTPPFVQPPGADTFVSLCTANGLSAVPGFAMPGCLVPGFLSTAFNSDGDPN
jgi:hypothetical protein